MRALPALEYFSRDVAAEVEFLTSRLQTRHVGWRLGRLHPLTMCFIQLIRSLCHEHLRTVLGAFLVLQDNQ